MELYKNSRWKSKTKELCIVKIFCKNKSTNLKKCEFGFNFKQNFLIFKLLSGRGLPRNDDYGQ